MEIYIQKAEEISSHYLVTTEVQILDFVFLSYIMEIKKYTKCFIFKMYIISGSAT